MTTADTDNARSQAKAQLDGIRQMLARLEHANECDGELEDCDMLSGNPDTMEAEADAWRDDYSGADFKEYHSVDLALQSVQEDPLSVEVRSGWHTPGKGAGDEEFMILLCTGGPAVRIMGKLDEYGQADRAWLEYQDWFTPWTEYVEPGISATLCEYANHFLGF